MLSCYELQSQNDIANDNAKKRRGQMDFHAISLPTHRSLCLNDDDDDGPADKQDMVQGGPLHFDSNPMTVVHPEQFSPSSCGGADGDGGILDGKWLEAEDPSFSNFDNDYVFASAHSSGRIHIHTLARMDANETASNEQEEEGENKQQSPYKIEHCGKSCPPNSDKDLDPLCLSLNWAARRFCHGGSKSPQLVSTYSDGRVAIHKVVASSITTSSSSTKTKPLVELDEQYCWQAHSLFGNCPAEVWSADFCGDEPDNLIVSCADDAKLKFWDVRCLNLSSNNDNNDSESVSTPRPSLMVSSSLFEAGTTCASHHPRQPHIVACGSYDETVALFDIRYMLCSSGSGKRQPLEFIRTNVGGGVWRLKWHPIANDRLLVAAMHGGCRVVNILSSSPTTRTTTTSSSLRPPAIGTQELSSSLQFQPESWSLEVTREFTLHESMAYGADWLVDPETQMEAAASCSFYDKSVYLWNTR